MYFVKNNNLAFAQQIMLLGIAMPELATVFGFTVKQVAAAMADANFMLWMTNSANLSEKHMHEYVDYVDAVRHDATGSVILPVPQSPVNPDSSVVVPVGIQARYVQNINQIKGNPNCSNDLLKKLNAVSIVAHKDSLQDKPSVSVALDGGFPQISFHKYGYTAANLYKNSGTGYGDKPFKTMTMVKFKDESPLPATGITQLIKYKMMYLLKDKETGLMSDEVSIIIGSK